MLPTYGYKQRNDYECGPTVARILLHQYLGMDIESVVKELQTSRNGTRDSKLLNFLKRGGIDFKIKKGANLARLKRSLKNNLVVVTFWLPRTQELHYSIVSRMDSKRIYFHDTWFGRNHSYTIDYFLRNWQHKEAEAWLLTILKPKRMRKKIRHT